MTVVRIVALAALIFGLVTIKSGGSVLLFDGEAREAAGNYVPFVVWFNFLAGFVYIIAAIGIFNYKPWSYVVALSITWSTLLVFTILGMFIQNNMLYEPRTIAAMSFRSVVWILITIYCYRKLIYRA